MPKKKSKKKTVSLKELHASVKTSSWADDHDEPPSAPSSRHLVTGEDQFPERRRFGDDDRRGRDDREREPLPPPRSDGDNNWRGSMGSSAGRDDRGRGRFSRDDRGPSDRDRDRGYGDRDRDRGRGDRDRGYGDRDRGRGDRGFDDRDRGFGRDRGYGDRNRGGYGDRDRDRDRDRYSGRDRGGYGDRDRGYGDRDRGYGDRDRGFNRDRGFGSSRPQDDWEGRSGARRPMLKLAPRTKPVPPKPVSKPKPVAQSPTKKTENTSESAAQKPKSNPFGSATPIDNEGIFAARKAAEEKAKATTDSTSTTDTKEDKSSKSAAKTERWTRGVAAPDRDRRNKSSRGRDGDFQYRRRDGEFSRRDDRDRSSRNRRETRPPEPTNTRWVDPLKQFARRDEPKEMENTLFSRVNAKASTTTKPSKVRDPEKERLLDEKMKKKRENAGTIRTEKLAIPEEHRQKVNSKARDPEKERLLDEKMKRMRENAGSIRIKKVEVPKEYGKSSTGRSSGKVRDPEKERLLDEKMKRIREGGAQSLAARLEQRKAAAAKKNAAAKDPLPVVVHVITEEEEREAANLDDATQSKYQKLMVELMKEFYQDRNAGEMILDDINKKITHRAYLWQLAFVTMDIACEARTSQVDRANQILRFLRCKAVDARLMAKALLSFAATVADKQIDNPKTPKYFKEMVKYALQEGLVCDVQLSSSEIRKFADLPEASDITKTLWEGKLGSSLVAPAGADPVQLLSAVLEYVSCTSISIAALVEPNPDDEDLFLFKAFKDDNYGAMLKKSFGSDLSDDVKYEIVKTLVAFAASKNFPTTVSSDENLLQTLFYTLYELEIVEDIDAAIIKWFEANKADASKAKPIAQVTDFVEILKDDSDEESDDE